MKNHLGYFKGFLFPAFVLVFHAIIFFLGAYDAYPSLDIPMHFLGGFSAAISLTLLFGELTRRRVIDKMSPVMFFVFIIGAVSLIAVFWEFGEFGADYLLNFNSQQGLADTMGDLFMGLLGGVVGFIVARI